jgi:peptidoglycan/xylan/chitin deacetylase (PgdA/CDA1 family)
VTNVPTKAVLCVTADNLGQAAAITMGAASRPDPQEAGIQGVPHMLDLLDRLGITVTYFVEGWNGLHHAEVIRSVISRGHEIGLHGWAHEKWESLSDGHREALLFDGTAALRLAGVEPAGFRAPGGYRGGRTAAVLRELGYSFDASIDHESEAEPIAVRRLPEGITNIPFAWNMIDAYHYYLHPEGERTPAQALAQFNATLDHAIDTHGLVTFIMHPGVSFAGDEERYGAVRDFLAGAVASPEVEVLSAGQLASRHLVANA